MTDILDKDSIRIQNEAKSIIDIIESAAWGPMKQTLVDKIIDLQDINNVDVSSIESIAIDLKARKLAATILFNWMQEIEGAKSQQEFNTVDKTYIVRS